MNLPVVRRVGGTWAPAYLAGVQVKSLNKLVESVFAQRPMRPMTGGRRTAFDSCARGIAAVQHWRIAPFRFVCRFRGG